MDERFSKVLTDPRFRRFKKKDTQVKIDERFAKVLSHSSQKKKGKGKAKDHHDEDNGFASEDFDTSHAGPSMDKYGRKITKKS